MLFRAGRHMACRVQRILQLHPALPLGVIMATCKICGAPHKACGPSPVVIPVDARIERKETTVGVKRYPVTVNGTDTVLVLSDDDAKKAGLFQEKSAPKKSAPKAANKSRTPANKAAAKPAAKPATVPAAAPAAAAEEK